MQNSTLISNITAEEFQELIRSMVREELQSLIPEGEPHYITRNEAAALLKITLTTLHRYSRMLS